MMTRLRRWAPTVVAGTALACIVGVGIVLGALAAGYRPVVIQTGSMGDTAPPGSLIVAAPHAATDIEVGDILVMRRPGATPVTHRVIEIERSPTTAFAITQGDANEAPDAAPYPLEGEELVARWIAPGWGGALETVFQPGIALIIVAMATLAMTVAALRRIWESPVHHEHLVRPSIIEAPDPAAAPGDRRRWLGLVALPLVGLMTVGIAWALFQSSEVVASNDFGTSACFDAQLASVQNGETVHAVNGTVTVPITPVDPTGAFVLGSVRSNGSDPADAAVQVRLANGGTDLELLRLTDAGAPPAVTVAWSVVAYGCGVSVQRGTALADGSAQIDVPITSVDTASSFAIVTSAPTGADTSFDGDDLAITELTAATNLRIRSAGGPGFAAGRTFAWQVVTFDDPGDIDVQDVGITLGLGVSDGSIPLPTPVDPATTFVLASAAATSSGPDIGERVVRAHLQDANTVAVSRGVAGDPIEVRVQVVTLLDGSTVRHGTVDFSVGQPARTIAIDPVDTTRSSAIATVAIPGLAAGGRTTMVADDVVGEASATFALSDARTVAARRDATTADASFGWQVIEWAGPSWWDTDYTFRQRIDVDTGAAAAPGAYTVPVDIDHAALVDAGLSGVGGADVRVLRWDGTAWSELDRVLGDGETWNTAATTIWFRTTDPIEADARSTYWLYFGNPTPAGALDDPENVWLLTEDFESGTLGDFEDRTAGTGWYAAAPWTRRIQVTVPAGRVAADLTDFPLLVDVTDADLAATAQSDGSDIRFTAADGTTPLPHEIETWDAGTGHLAAWVLVPSIVSGGATTIHLYYGAADAPAQQDPPAAWPAAVEAVWHLDDDPSGPAPQVDDSSANNNDGLGAASMTPADLTAGIVGGAVDLDGVDDVLDIEPFDVGGAPGLTMSGWVNLDSYVNDGRVVTKGTDPLNRVFELSVRNAGELRGRVSIDGSTVEVVSAPGLVTLGAWHHVAATWDGTLRLYVNGSEVASTAAVGTLDTNTAMPVTLGNLATLDRQLDGRLDEVRVERIARSAAWLAAAEANQRTPGTFLVVGSVETGSWFDQGAWTFRKPVSIAPALTASDLADFVTLIQVIDDDLRVSARADGADIVFTAADGVTRVDHVVETYDTGTGALTAWVSVPLVSAADGAQLFLYYGNAGASSQEDPPAVFGPDADLALLGGS